MRVIGYPPLPPGSEGISCGAHKGEFSSHVLFGRPTRRADPFQSSFVFFLPTDYGCLTLLSADPTPSALQVLLRPTPVPGKPAAGEEEGDWIDADPREGCLVVNVGESLCILLLSLRERLIADTFNVNPLWSRRDGGGMDERAVSLDASPSDSSF